MGGNTSWPTHDDVRKILELLATGELTPEQAEAWSKTWVMDDELSSDVDDAVWDALVKLSGAAIEEAPGKLLHRPDDFWSWLETYDARLGRRNGDGSPRQRRES